jgi:RNA polymerase sigma-70 factor (ECF subfamily)
MTDERFDAAARQWMDTVFRLAYSYTKNREDADDVTQEVLLKLYREEKEFSSEEHLRNWLIRVTLNACKSLFRSPWRRRESLEDYAQTLGFEQPEQSGLFLAVMSLERKYRLPLLLYYYFGYSVREIGTLLQLPVNTVSTRLYRARAKLREQLTEE